MVKQGTLKTPKQPPARKSPTSSIQNIGSLKRFPDREHALDIIHDLAKLVAPIMHEKGFKITTLCEMYPKNRNLLGLNVNKGQKVLLRLRLPSNDRLFLPMGDLIGTLLHELTHNLYGPHDKTFFDYMDSLKKRFEEIQYGGASVGGYICEEQKLGRGIGFLSSGYKSIREKRLNAVTKVQYKAGTHRLGSLSKDYSKNLGKNVTNLKLTMRQLILLATERRIHEDKTCGETHNDIVLVNDDELMTYDVVGEGFGIKARNPGGSNVKPAVSREEKKISTEIKDKNMKKYQEIVDLTGEEYEEPKIEIVEINACSKDEKSCSTGPKSRSKDPKSILKLKKENDEGHRLVSFELLPSFEEGGFSKNDGIGISKLTSEMDPEFVPMIGEIQYVTSTSPRTFIEENTKYPRRKLVADLNFNQIMEFQKGDLLDAAPFQESTFRGSFNEIEDDFDVKCNNYEQDNIVSIPIENVKLRRQKLKIKSNNKGKEDIKVGIGRTAKYSKGQRLNQRQKKKTEKKKEKTENMAITEISERKERKTVKTIQFEDLL